MVSREYEYLIVFESTSSDWNDLTASRNIPIEGFMPD